MDSLERQYAGRGLKIIALNMDVRPQDAQAFLSVHKPAFDVTTGADPACAHAFGVATMPSTYLIDRKGMLRSSHFGFRESDAAVLRTRVRALLDEPSID
jgi:hypothetical protein